MNLLSSLIIQSIYLVASVRPHFSRIAQVAAGAGYNNQGIPIRQGSGGAAVWWWWLILVAVFLVVILLVGMAASGARSRFQNRRRTLGGTAADIGTVPGQGGAVARRGYIAWTLMTIAFLIVVGIFIGGVIWWGRAGVPAVNEARRVPLVNNNAPNTATASNVKPRTATANNSNGWGASAKRPTTSDEPWTWAPGK